MNQQFWIQASNPRIDPEAFPEESLPDAIEELFPLDNEFAFIAWKGIFVPIGYRYDLSVMVRDILDLVERLTSAAGSRDTFEIHWASQSFASVWTVSRSGDEVAVRAEWRDVIGKTEELLNSSGAVEVRTEEFVREWQKILQVLTDRLLRTSWGNEVLEFSELQRLAEIHP